MKSKFFLTIIIVALFVACDFGNNNSSPSVSDAGYGYIGMVQTYRQELLTSSQRNSSTGLYETRWIFYEDEVCPVYEKDGLQYVKWNDRMYQICGMNEVQFPEEYANGFTHFIDTKGNAKIVLR